MSDLVRQVLRSIEEAVRPVRVSVHNMIARAVVDLVNDSTKAQSIQLTALADETLDGLERLQNYGVTSVPKPGAEAVVLFLGGERSHGVVIAVEDRRYRLKGLAGGEVALYDWQGSSIVLKANGDIEVTPLSRLTRIAGDVQVEGTLTAGTDVIGGGVSLKTHLHSVSGVAPAGGGPVVFPASKTGGPA